MQKIKIAHPEEFKMNKEIFKLLEMKKILENIILEKRTINEPNDERVEAKIRKLKKKIKEFESLKKEGADEKINNL